MCDTSGKVPSGITVRGGGGGGGGGGAAAGDNRLFGE